MGRFNYQGPDVANAYAAGVQMKQAQERNDLAKNQDDRIVKEQADAKATDTAKVNAYNKYRMANESGDEAGAKAGLEELYQLDPNAASSLEKAVKEGKQQEVQKAADQRGSQIYAIISSQDPAKAYATWHESLPDPIKRTTPDQFDEGWANLQLATATKAIDYIKSIGENKGKATEEARKSRESNALVNERVSSTKLNEAKAVSETQKMNDAKAGGGQKWYDYKDNILTVLSNKPDALWTPEERKIYSEIIKDPVGEYGAPKEKPPIPGSPIDLNQFMK